MTRDLLMLLGGLVLIVKGGDWFVGAAVRLAGLLKMPRAVVGSTLVSLATTTPELVVSLMAGAKGEPGLAVGNAVGSCICNIGLILGTTAVIRTVTLDPSVLARPLGAMIAASLALVLFTLDFRLGRAAAAILLIAGIAYFTWDFLHHLRRRSSSELSQAKAIEDAAEGRFAWLQTPAGTGCQFLGAAAVVILGSRLLVDGAVALATALGIPSLVIGLTIVAIGTSLPEFITAITSSRRSVSDLAVGNVLGANIANLTLIIGTAGLIQEVIFGRDTHFFHFPVMLMLMGLLLWKLGRDRKLSHRDGWLLIGVYAAYLLIVVALTAIG